MRIRSQINLKSVVRCLVFEFVHILRMQTETDRLLLFSVRLQFGFDCGFVSVWFLFDAVSVPFLISNRFALDLVSVRFGLVFSSLRILFQFASDSVSVRFGLGFGSLWIQVRFVSDWVSVRFGFVSFRFRIRFAGDEIQCKLVATCRVWDGPSSRCSLGGWRPLQSRMRVGGWGGGEV